MMWMILCSGRSWIGTAAFRLNGDHYAEKHRDDACYLAETYGFTHFYIMETKAIHKDIIMSGITGTAILRINIKKRKPRRWTKTKKRERLKLQKQRKV